MIVSQAVYGARPKGGHGLLEFNGDENLAKAVAQYLDLPDTIPFGINCPSYIAGFQYETYYVLARISPDNNATRAGMVFSHALFLPIEDMIQIVDLNPLLTILVYSYEEFRTKNLMDSDFNRLIFNETVPDSLSTDFVRVANSLINTRIYPVIYFNPENFENIIVSLWGSLWPTLRKKLVFRLSFSLRDLEKNNPPIIVCCPASLQSRWHGYLGIHPSSNALEPNSLSSQLLCGMESAQPLRKFMMEIEADIKDFKQLRLLESAFQRHEQDCFDSRLSTLRLIEVLSPNQENGVGFKRKYLADFLKYITPKLIPSRFFQLQNLNLAAFQNIEEYWTVLHGWILSQNFSPADDVTFVEKLGNVLNEKSGVSVKWTEAILSGIREIANKGKPDFFSAIWRWIAVDPIITRKLIDLIDEETTQLEDNLIIMSPAKLSSTTGDIMRKIAVSKNWIAVHAATLAAYEPPLEAIRQQLHIDKNTSDNRGVLQALKYASDEEIIDGAIQCGDERVILLAANKAATCPSLLADLNFYGERAQKVWLNALKLNSSTWNVSEKTCDLAKVIFDSWLQGAKTAGELVEVLSVHPQIADLYYYDKRCTIWMALKNQAVRERYLNTTAKGWLDRSIINQVPFLPDNILEQSILTRELVSEFEKLPSNQYNRSIDIIKALPHINEQTAVQWIRIVLVKMQPISLIDARSFGVLIKSNHWREVLRCFVDSYKIGRTDVKPILIDCADMIGFWEGWFLGIRAFSLDDYWREVENVAVELYPSGPSENSLWSRADGKESDLRHDGSGREQWLYAIRKCRYGSYPKLKKLLQIMIEDFPLNKKLTWLKSNQEKIY